MIAINQFQEKFGKPSRGAATKVVPYMNDWVQTFIRHAPFAILASSDAAGRCDASPKGGMPGFVKVLDETHLLIPDVAGNRLFQSYDNVSRNPHVGLLFLSLASIRRRVSMGRWRWWIARRWLPRTST